MAMPRPFATLLAICALAAAFPGDALAECGGTTQCIGVGPTRAAAAVAHHGLGPATFTMSFAAALGAQSGPQTIFVEAVTGPPGTMAKLGPIRVDGPDAAEFVIAGGTCSTSRGPVHGGEGCTVEVAFRPTAPGDKTATVHVPVDPPGCVGCILERTVTVTGTVGRANPALDAAVAGIVQAQVESARRFSLAQIGNVHGRLEALHPRGPQAAAATQAAQSAGFWAGGRIDLGGRGSAGSATGTDFTTDGVSVGADRAFANGLVAGIALGAARDRTDIGTNGTHSRARGASAMAYASFSPAPGLHLDALAGGGPLDFRSTRRLGVQDASAEADRDGSLAFGSLAAAWEWSASGVLLAPYGRLDYSRERLDAATETAPAGHALTYHRQDSSALHAAAGLRAETIRETRHGRVVPRARVEWRRAVRTRGEATVGYADLPDDAPFVIEPWTQDRDSLALGLGLDLLRGDGLVLGLDYQWLRASSLESGHAFRLTVSQALDGRGPAAWAGLTPEAVLRKAEFQLDAGFGHDDNLSRAADSRYAASDSFFTGSVRASDSWALGPASRAVVAGTVGGDAYRTYRGLGRATAGLEAELQFRPSAGFGAPTFAIFGQARTEQFESRMRDGERFTAGASMRAAATDRIGLFAALSHQRTRARADVFDGSDNGARVHADWQLPGSRSLYVAGEYRRGDIVFAANPLPLLAAKHDEPPVYPGGGVPDDVFVVPQLVDYKTRGTTALATVGFNFPVGPRESIDFSWRYARSKPSDAASLPAGLYDGTTPTYTSNQFLLLYLMSF
jgi:outer membrane autotransporter protein